MGERSSGARRVCYGLWVALVIALVIVGIEVTIESAYTAGLLALAGGISGAAIASGITASGRSTAAAASWAYRAGWRIGFVAGAESQRAREEYERYDTT